MSRLLVNLKAIYLPRAAASFERRLGRGVTATPFELEMPMNI